MPPYSQVGPVSQLLSKCIGYSWGKPPGAPCRIQITSIAIASNVATVIGILLEGFGPIADVDLAVLSGVALQGGALNNQGPQEITSVTGPDINGNITIVFPLTGTDVGTTPSAGVILTIPEPQPEAGATGPGQVWAVPEDALGLSWDFNFDGDVTIQLEGAITNDPAQFALIGTAVTGAELGTSLASVPENVNFVRLNITSGTQDGWARILAS